MLYDAIRDFLVGVITDMLFWISYMTKWLIETSLCIENAAWVTDNPITAALVNQIFLTIYGFVFILMVLKFLWKGTNIYILWRDGDSEVSPYNMLVNMGFAVVAAIAFPTLYRIAVNATVEFADSIRAAINEYWVGRPNFDWAENSAKAQQIWDAYFEQFAVTYPGQGLLTSNELQLAVASAPNVEIIHKLLALWLLPNNNEPMFSVGFIEAYLNGVSAQEVVDATANLNLAGVIAAIVYNILYVIMFIQLLGRGVEMLFLRWGFPIAAVGYLDSDGGITHSYVQLFFRQFATSVFQVIALYISFYVAIDFQLGHILLGLAIIGAAFRGPVLLSQILAPQKNGGGFGQKLHSALMVRQLFGGHPHG